MRATCFLNPSRSWRHCLAASMFAGLSSFGLLSMEMILTKMVSTVCTGDQRSLASSYPLGSSPGACKMLMHTRPSA